MRASTLASETGLACALPSKTARVEATKAAEQRIFIDVLRPVFGVMSLKSEIEYLITSQDVKGVSPVPSYVVTQVFPCDLTSSSSSEKPLSVSALPSPLHPIVC
jgi:hypothetical protein